MQQDTTIRNAANANANKNIKVGLKELCKKRPLSPSPSGACLPGDCLALYACPACEPCRCPSDLWISTRYSFDVIDE